MTAGPSHHLETRSARLIKQIQVELADEDWRERAACQNEDWRLWFAETRTEKDRRDRATAMVICQGCPVRADCLRWALARGERGIWGGTNDNERRAALRAKQNR